MGSAAKRLSDAPRDSAYRCERTIPQRGDVVTRKAELLDGPRPVVRHIQAVSRGVDRYASRRPEVAFSHSPESSKLRIAVCSVTPDAGPVRSDDRGQGPSMHTAKPPTLLPSPTQVERVSRPSSTSASNRFHGWRSQQPRGMSHSGRLQAMTPRSPLGNCLRTRPLPSQTLIDESRHETA
jgi:hypothetical protein